MIPRSLGHRAPLFWLVLPYMAGLAAGKAGEFVPVLWLLARLDGRLDPALLRVGLARRRARALGQGMPQR